MGCVSIPENEIPSVIKETKNAEVKKITAEMKTAVRTINSLVKKPKYANNLEGSMRRALADQEVYDAKDSEFMQAGVILCGAYANTSIENIKHAPQALNSNYDHQYYKIGTVQKGLYSSNVYCRVGRIFDGNEKGYDYVGINVKVLIDDTLVKDFGDIK